MVPGRQTDETPATKNQKQTIGTQCFVHAGNEGQRLHAWWGILFAIPPDQWITKGPSIPRLR